MTETWITPGMFALYILFICVLLLIMSDKSHYIIKTINYTTNITLKP